MCDTRINLFIPVLIIRSLVHSFSQSVSHSFLHFHVSHHHLKAVIFHNHDNLSCIMDYNYYLYYYVLNKAT
jgi:hypothetical protein